MGTNYFNYIINTNTLIGVNIYLLWSFLLGPEANKIIINIINATNPDISNPLWDEREGTAVSPLLPVANAAKEIVSSIKVANFFGANFLNKLFMIWLPFEAYSMK